METSCVVNNESGSRLSGSLQEVYTDFDAWITKWKRRFKQRSQVLSLLSPVNTELQTTDEETTRNLILDLFFYGVVDKKNMATNNKFFNSKLSLTEDCVSLDYILFKLLLSENGGQRILLVNSKL
ncbi:hypothetical protein evm_006304 [Chilo suppressalis]|nr:hypothetical protein evm_006304 [Chilo suppressalis]